MLPLVRRARGRIVLASSILTHVAAPVRGVHAASLAALDALAACLRRELKPRGVDVVSICLTGGISKQIILASISLHLLRSTSIVNI